MEPRILLTNDDGHESRGLAALARRAAKLGEVWVVAPSAEVSAISHAVSLRRPLRARRLRERWFAVDGTPADCVFLAVGELLPFRPDLLISGINCGGNVAVDVTYSGTVAAAFEGALRRIPSLAVSRNSFDDGDYGPAADLAVHLAGQLLEHGLPDGVFLNVNVPPLAAGEVRGVVAAPLGQRAYSEDLVERVDPRGKPYYWIAGTKVVDEPVDGTDCIAVADGYATVTPLQVDWTAHRALDALRGWELDPR